jgi:DNA (cytosine-5)-methyltransferase 1
MPIRFVDLFAGIGGFHAVGHAFGWSPGYACDIDEHAREIYEHNWSFSPATDITEDANDEVMRIPSHDVLFAGFPCQPFSKSGKQKGMDEARGTLFWNIARTIEINTPAIVLLENVPNLAGPRHKEDWEVIIKTLRDLGYRVATEPLVVSPHKIPMSHGGRPQTRKRIYIAATYVPIAQRRKYPLEASQIILKDFDWHPDRWDLLSDIKMEKNSNSEDIKKLKISNDEKKWLNAWDEFIREILILRNHEKLPGFPIWADVWLGNIKKKSTDPQWKIDFIQKNRQFYEDHRKFIDAWLKKYQYLEDFPASRRKLEWQAGEVKSLYKCLIQLRPSGIRVKKMNYAPALVAITQTTIVGPLRRKMSVREVAQLQGLPSWFSFRSQPLAKSYKQLGNGISIGCAFQVIRALAERDREVLQAVHPRILKSINSSGENPDVHLRKKP